MYKTVQYTKHTVQYRTVQHSTVYCSTIKDCIVHTVLDCVAQRRELWSENVSANAKNRTSDVPCERILLCLDDSRFALHHSL